MPEASKSVPVRLPGREYEVFVGEGILSTLGSKAAEVLAPGRCAVLTDSNVGPLYGEEVEASLREAGFEPERITIEAGEASKSMAVAEDCCRRMIRAGLDRSSSLFALGGGVVGDLAGFVAAIFYRGIPLVQIPTSVVAQVDSSVGGKTGVNTAEGKNLIGAFLQPRLVLADTATLRTLADRDYNEGFAEIIKHAAIRDAGMFDLIRAARGSREGLAPLVARNVAIKARIVEEDERETTGTRALLNFGHTIGHGIEAAAGYGGMLHGEAISLGLAAAAHLSTRIAGLPGEDASRITEELKAYRLPLALPADIDTEDVIDRISRDKKFVGGQVRFVLLRTLGNAFLSKDVTSEDIIEAIETLR